MSAVALPALLDPLTLFRQFEIIEDPRIDFFDKFLLTK